jgi:hypothetical protein
MNVFPLQCIFLNLVVNDNAWVVIILFDLVNIYTSLSVNILLGGFIMSHTKQSYISALKSALHYLLNNIPDVLIKISDDISLM